VLAAGLLAGGCAGNNSVSSLESMLGPSQQTTASAAAGGASADATSRSELDKAIAYWGDEHKKKPADVKVALAYAKNLKAGGHKEQAYSILQGAAVIHGDNKELASEMGRLAIEFGQIGMAEKLLSMADDPLKPDWRILSARGTVLAKQNKFAESIPVFERALALAPNQPSVLNNLAMAHAASGEPAKAEEILRRAATGSGDPKIRQNLALVLGLQGRHDEARTATANVVPIAVASADADYVRRMVKATPVPAPGQQVAPSSALAQNQPRGSAASGSNIAQARAPAGTTAGRAIAGMRPASGPGDVVNPAGAWSTSVQLTR